ncbi:unnamed protein product, partial [Brachionus calyciflorus]
MDEIYSSDSDNDQKVKPKLTFNEFDLRIKQNQSIRLNDSISSVETDNFSSDSDFEVYENYENNDYYESDSQSTQFSTITETETENSDEDSDLEDEIYPGKDLAEKKISDVTNMPFYGNKENFISLILFVDE